MKTVLICPAFRPAVAQLAEAVPLAIVPILGENLANYWLEHVAALGARQVIVIAADRPELVRAAVGDGRRWGVHIEFVGAHAEIAATEAAARYRAGQTDGWLPAPHAVVVMDHLPGCAELPLFDSYAGWFRALHAWMPRALTPARVRVSELRPGVWVGSGARIAPAAELRGPCWIGEGVTIGAGAVIGPGAIIEERAVIGAGGRVAHSVVGPDTFVGRLTCIADSIAVGSLLINWRNDSVLRVPDSFLLCSLVDMPSLVPNTGAARALAALVRLAGKPWKPLGALLLRSNRARGTNFPL
jgi:hypothetical protein